MRKFLIDSKSREHYFESKSFKKYILSSMSIEIRHDNSSAKDIPENKNKK